MTNWHSNDDNNNHNPPNPEDFDEWDEPNQNSPMYDPPSQSDIHFASSSEELSKEAQRFINQHFDRNNIQRVRESMEADGYSQGSPKAEMWDLRIQTNDGVVHFFTYYHFCSRGERLGYEAN